MSSDLLSIGASGARAARAALDVTAQNIANAATEGYVRRSTALQEVARASGVGNAGDISLSGVRVSGVIRAADLYRAAEVRRTAGDAARAGTELQELENLESAIERSGLFDAVAGFEASLHAVAAYPVEPGLRAAVLSGAERVAGAFAIAADSLTAAGDNSRALAQADVDRFNASAGELARINAALPRAGQGSAEAAHLADQRDRLLADMADKADIAVAIDPAGRARVTMGGAAGLVLVDGNVAQSLAMATAADGTIGFSLGGAQLGLTAGSLAGRAQALDRTAAEVLRLDTLANDMAGQVNAVQLAGVALDGSPGQPMFSGNGAANLRLALASGDDLATAPAGAGAASRDPANVRAMIAALGNGGANTAGGVNTQLLDLSSAIAARKVTGEALTAIAGSARMALDRYSGVDLDREATELIRFQQAFQASGRVMQVASDLFDTMIGIG